MDTLFDGSGELYRKETGRRERLRRWSVDDAKPRSGARKADVEGADRQVRARRQLLNAIRQGDAVAARRLLAAGADARQGPLGRGSPLMEAVLAFDEERIELELGADVAAGARDRAAPIIPMLLGAGATPDAPDADGVTPLMVAARQGASHAVAQLLVGGARVDLVDRYGRRAMEHARATVGSLDLAAQGEWAKPGFESRRAAARRCVERLSEAFTRWERAELASVARAGSAGNRAEDRGACLRNTTNTNTIIKGRL